ncbi:hypothetical protein HPB47_013130, partial [Ixodes persulcatus]
RRDPNEAKLNATGADTPQKDAMKDGEEEGSNNESTVQSSSLKMLILSLTAKVDLLVGTVKIMREENAMIRSELQRAKSLWTQLVRDAPKITDRAAPRAHKSYAGAMRKDCWAELRSTISGMCIWLCLRARQQYRRGSILCDRLSDRRRISAFGACTNASLSSIPRQPVKRALFVTRLSPDTTCEDVNNYLSS